MRPRAATKLLIFLIILLALELGYLAFLSFFQPPVRTTAQAYGLKIKVDNKAYRKLQDKIIKAKGGLYHPGKRQRVFPARVELALTNKPQPYGRIVDPRRREVLKSFNVSYNDLPQKLVVTMQVNKRLLFDEQGRLKPNAGSLLSHYFAEILYYLVQEEGDFYTGDGYQQYLRFSEENEQVINSLFKLSTQ